MDGLTLLRLRLADRASIKSMACRMSGGSDRVKAIESSEHIRESTRRIYLRALDGAVSFRSAAKAGRKGPAKSSG